MQAGDQYPTQGMTMYGCQGRKRDDFVNDTGADVIWERVACVDVGIVADMSQMDAHDVRNVRMRCREKPVVVGLW